MTTRYISPSKKDFADFENGSADPQPSSAGLRILVVVDSELRFEHICSHGLRGGSGIGTVHWIAHYDAARDALGRQHYDVAVLDSHHHGVSLLDDMADCGSATGAVLLVDDKHNHRAPAGVTCAFLTPDALGTGRLPDAICDIRDRAAQITPAHSQTWWRCGGTTVSHANDFPVPSETYANFFFDAAVQEERAELQSRILRHLPVIAGRLDATGHIREADGAGWRRHGLDPRELRGTRFVSMFPESSNALERARRGEAVRFEAHLDSGVDRKWDIEIDLLPDKESDRGVLFFGQEATTHRNLEGEILRAVETERHRLGADLHDDVGQLLTGITCLSTALVQRLQGRDDLAAENAISIAEVAKEALAQMRALAHGLAPVHLARQGLAGALDELRLQVQRTHDVEVRLQFPAGRNDFDGETTTHLFRIAQEAIANAIRHGKATTIEVSLRAVNGQHCLAIADNGQGFDPETPHKAPGAGLGLMEYRASLIGGRLAVSSDRATGTCIEVSFNFLNTYPHENAC